MSRAAVRVDELFVYLQHLSLMNLNISKIYYILFQIIPFHTQILKKQNHNYMHIYAYPNLGCNAISDIIDMIPQEQERPIIVSKVKHLGSCILPSPIELEATIVLYHNRIHIAELDATIPVAKVSGIEVVKGKDLPSQTIVMFGVVGAIVEKDKPYVIIEIGSSPDSLLFRFEDMTIADKLVEEINAAKDLQ
jgi:hypothetical protein